MAPDKREWSVPAPVRALLWWPGAAFVLVMVAPDAAAVGIAAAGVLLVTLGLVLPAVSRRLRRPRPGPSRAFDDHPTVEMPTVEMPPVGRAA
jgi:membrane protein implicated in regulation of membrane protease activity